MGQRLRIAFLFPKLTKEQQKVLLEQKLKQMEQEPPRKMSSEKYIGLEVPGLEVLDFEMSLIAKCFEPHRILANDRGKV